MSHTKTLLLLALLIALAGLVGASRPVVRVPLDCESSQGEWAADPFGKGESK